VKRTLIVGGLALLLVVGLAGGVWAYSAKVWLWDDFRAGYDVGQNLQRNSSGDDPCQEAAAEKYGRKDASNEAAMFWSGCDVARAGLRNDYWNVSGYLSD
jgi:hypothetical protein